MSEARDEYYKVKKEADEHFGGLVDILNTYILELESDKAELIELANSMLIFIPVDALEIYFSDKEVELIKQIQGEVKSRKED